MNSEDRLHILFIAPYPKGIGPSQRFRFEHYLGSLAGSKIMYSYSTFISEHDYPFLHQKGGALKKAVIIMKGFLNRFLLLFTMFKYDFIYIHREAAPVGPPIFEWIIAKIFRKKIIYDFDDSIWVFQASEANPFAALLKCTWKVRFICKWSWKISVGNQFLSDFAKKYNKSVFIIPTVVDTDTVHFRPAIASSLFPKVIGWTGTFTNFINLPIVIPALRRLEKECSLDILFIADRDPLIPDLRYRFKKWNKGTEIADLCELDIGLMPLLNEEVQKGKCGFKAIQYMALEIPAVVSPVGVNAEIVDEGVNGYFANTTDEWYSKLKQLLNDDSKRTVFGKNARDKIISSYSVKSTRSLFLSLFTSEPSHNQE
ncbi:MAG: glycosyltransferase family 4 protein [Niabella sp.]|nr:glycosyltransferase family 4 protein [Niabella sp.]